jgi:hypothetical protein
MYHYYYQHNPIIAACVYWQLITDVQHATSTECLKINYTFHTRNVQNLLDPTALYEP